MLPQFAVVCFMLVVLGELRLVGGLTVHLLAPSELEPAHLTEKAITTSLLTRLIEVLVSARM